MNTLPSKYIIRIALASILLIILLVFTFRSFCIVPAGHVGVVNLFGKINQTELSPGLQLKNPFATVEFIDCRDQANITKGLRVTSQDQLATSIDVTVKWKVDRDYAAEAIEETGGLESLEVKHLQPKIRSLVREAGKGISNAEEFYRDEVVRSMQAKILNDLQNLRKKGILVEEVLLRDITLPKLIEDGVLKKKRQAQLAEQEINELRRYTTEQKKLEQKKKAERKAAEEDALKRKILADAQAYEIIAKAKARAAAIKIEGEALKNTPELLQLRSIEKWNGNVPKVVLGNKSIPMINLNSINKTN